MPLPRAVARFNKRVTNRFLEPIARRFAGFAVVHHVGRRSGTAYTTPVNLFALDVTGEAAVVSLTYGPSADWVQNVPARGGIVEQRGSRRTIASSAVVGRHVALPVLPAIVRGALRIMRVREFMQLSLESGVPGESVEGGSGRR